MGDHFCHPGFFCHIIEFVLAFICLVLYCLDKQQYESIGVFSRRLNTDNSPRGSKRASVNSKWFDDAFHNVFNALQKNTKRERAVGNGANENISSVYIQGEIVDKVSSILEPALRIFDEPHELTVEMNTTNATSDDAISTKVGTLEYMKAANRGKETRRGEKKSSAPKLDVINCAILGFFVPTTLILVSFLCSSPIWNLTFIIVALPLAVIYLAAGGIICAAYDQASALTRMKDEVLANGILLILCGLCYVIDFVLHLLLFIKGRL